MVAKLPNGIATSSENGLLSLLSSRSIVPSQCHDLRLLPIMTFQHFPHLLKFDERDVLGITLERGSRRCFTRNSGTERPKALLLSQTTFAIVGNHSPEMVVIEIYIVAFLEA